LQRWDLSILKAMGLLFAQLGRPASALAGVTTLLIAVGVRASTIAPDTIVDARLTTAVSSQQPPGQKVEAVVTAPVLQSGVPVLAPGTLLCGKTADVKAAGTTGEAATLRILFTTIQSPGGKAQSLSAQVSAVDNVRESIGQDGLITGILASETWYGRMDTGISKVTTKYPGLGQILGSVRDSFVKQVDASISYAAGTDFQVKLTKPLDWKGPSNGFSVGTIEPADELTKLVNAQPNRTAAVKPPKPSDLTNLMFLGTAEQVKAAFQEAGWSTAAALDQSSTMETARAIIENRGYKEAPVSVLTLDGQPPTFVSQKAANTFAMRHHMRVWQRPDQFEGQPVWVAAATHDIGIDFSPENHTFIHKIDSNIDRERVKVINDLSFSKCVKGVALVDRTNIPPDLSNATGDKLVTDGKMAVVQLQTKP
jgi:hypothetical protein